MSDKTPIRDTRAQLKELEESALVSLAKKQLPYVTLAYEELLRRYQRQLHSIAFRYLNNDADAEEVVHDVMLKVFVHLKKFEERSSFKTWVYRLTYNESVDKIRSLSKHAHVHDIELDMFAAETKAKTNRQEKEVLAKYMAQLPAVDRAIVVFRAQFELDYKEIAEIMDLNLSTVKMKYRRALDKLNVPDEFNPDA